MYQSLDNLSRYMMVNIYIDFGFSSTGYQLYEKKNSGNYVTILAVEVDFLSLQNQFLDKK